MSHTPATPRASIVEARPKTAATLFVCKDCSLGKERRREFKRALSSAGGKRALRVVGCGCLDLCPKRGTATILARAAAPLRCAVVDDRANGADALGALLGGDHSDEIDSPDGSTV